MKKYLILTTFYRPFIGGAEISVEEIITRLQDKFEFIVLTAKGKKNLPRREQKGKILICRLGIGFKYDKYLYPPLALIKSFFIKFDGVYAVMASYAGLAALLIKRFRRRPYILNLQSGTLDKRAGNWVVKKIHLGADRIVAISRSLEERALKIGVPEEKIFVVPNGIDFGLFNVPWAKHNRSQIISVARLEKVKGIEYLIKAMPEVLKRHPEAELLIAGDGSQRPALESLVKSLGLGGRIRFLGRVEHKQLPQLMAAANIFACPSLAEGFGIVCLEAMACDLAVVASNVGGIVDIVQHKVNGLLVEPADPGVLARSIVFLLDNPDFTRQLVANGRQFVKNYDWDIISQKVAALL